MIEDQKCSFSIKIQEWLDNPEDATLAAEVRKHLSHCKLCPRELGSLQLVRAALKRKFITDLAPASSDSVNRVMAAVVSCARSNSTKGMNSGHGSLTTLISAWWPQLGVAFALLVFVALLQFYAVVPPASPVKKLPGLADNFYSLIVSKHDQPFMVETPQQMPVEEQPLALNRSYRLNPAAVILVTNPGMKLTFSRSARFTLHENRVDLNNGSVNAVLREYEPGFYVKIPDAEIYPTGTDFKIDINTSHAQIELRTGKLTIKSLSGQTVKMSDPGRLFVLAGGKIDTSLPVVAPTHDSTLAPALENSAPIRNDKSDSNNSTGASPKSLLDSF